MKGQYFMYGVLVPYEKYKEWEDGIGRRFPVDSHGDIFCFLVNRDGKHMIIGKKIGINNNESPIRIPELTELEQFEVEDSVRSKFGFEGDFHYYFITQ